MLFYVKKPISILSLFMIVLDHAILCEKLDKFQFIFMAILDHVILFENSANFNFIVCGCSKPHLFTYEYSYIFGVNK